MAGGSPQAGGAPIPIGSNLTVRRHVGPDGGVLQLRGNLDRTFDGPKMVQSLHSAAVIDLDGVTGIENAALPPWLATMQALEQLDVVFIRATTALMIQFNNTAGFAGAGQLLSGYAPFTCSACGASQDVVLDFRTVRPEPGPEGLIRVPCFRCREMTRGAEDVRRYFRFVRTAPAPIASAAITKLLELVPEHLTATRSSRRLDFEERQAVSGLWMAGPLIGELGLAKVVPTPAGPILVSGREVTGADATGVQQLMDFLVANRSASLAEVTPPLARALARDPRATQKPLASLWLPFDCLAERAHRFEAPVDGEALDAFKAGEELTTTCPQCGQQAAAGSSRELPGLLGRLTFQRLGLPFLDFLGRHPNGIDRTPEPETPAQFEDEGSDRTQFGAAPSSSQETYSGVAPRAEEQPVLDPSALAAEAEDAPAEMLAESDAEEEILAKADDGPVEVLAMAEVEPTPIRPNPGARSIKPASPPRKAEAAPAPSRTATAPDRPSPVAHHPAPQAAPTQRPKPIPAPIEEAEELTPQPDQPLPVQLDVLPTTAILPAAPKAAPPAPRIAVPKAIEAPPKVAEPPPKPVEPPPKPVPAQARAAETTEPERPLPSGPLERFGNYEVLEFLGQGGMADVVLARQIGPGGFVRKVALKRILPHHARNPEFVEMFLREARVAAQLNHPNVVMIYEFGEHSGRYFMAIEYVRGWDLQGILKLMGQLGEQMPIPIACRIIADLCAGLGSAHSHVNEEDQVAPIIHRDISPHNVLISDRGVVKLADFGIAKDAANDAHTRADMVKGKTAYLAPERILGSVDPLDVRPDLFAVGIVLHQCLVNEHPFQRDNDLATMKALLDEPVPPVRRKRADATRGLEFVLAKALVKDPNRRYSSALEIRDGLEAEIREIGQPATTVEVGLWVRGLQERGKAVASKDASVPKHTPSTVSRPGVPRIPVKAETGPQAVSPESRSAAPPKVKTGPKVPVAPAPAQPRPAATPRPAAPPSRAQPPARPPLPPTPLPSLPSLADDEEEERTMIDPRPSVSKQKPPRR